MAMVHQDDLKWSKSSIVDESLISDLFYARYGVIPSRIDADTKAAGDYNKCYYITFDTAPLGDESLKELVIRLARSTFPHIKTEHEVACMHTIGRPAPEVVFYDSSASNILGFEHICMKRICSPTLRFQLLQLSAAAIDRFFAELVDLTAQMWTIPVPQKICGLQLKDGWLMEGPLLEEWMIPEADIRRYWLDASPKETVHSLLAYLRIYLRMIETHPRLDFLHSLVPQLGELVTRLQSSEEPWTKRCRQSIPMRLFHRDMHDGQILVSEEGSITGLLDFEFSGVMPAFEVNCWHVAHLANSLRQQDNPVATALAHRLEIDFWPTFQLRYPDLAKQVEAETDIKQTLGAEGEALEVLRYHLRRCCDAGVRDFGDGEAARGVWKRIATEKLDFYSGTPPQDCQQAPISGLVETIGN